MALVDYVVHCFFGCILVLYTFHFLLRTLLQTMTNSLTYGQRYVISTKIVSGVFALVTSVIAARTLVSTTDIMRQPDTVLETYTILMCGYFAYDIIVMYRGFVEKLRDAKKLNNRNTKQLVKAFLRRELFIVIHHAVLQCLGLPVAVVMLTRRGLGVFFMAGVFIAEISTPFYSIRGILTTIGKTSGVFYEVNGFCFMITFFFGRICSFPYLYYRYSIYANLPLYSVPFKIPLMCNVASFAFFALQSYWFYLIIRTVFNYLLKSKSKQELGVGSTSHAGNRKVKNGHAVNGNGHVISKSNHVVNGDGLVGNENCHVIKGNGHVIDSESKKTH